jgi:modulator of FtsH protease HflK
MMNNASRGTRVAMIAAGFHVAFTVVMWIVAGWAHSAAAGACALMLSEGLALWLMTALLFYARQLADREAHEIAALAESTSASIFEGDTLSVQQVAQRRLESITRWGVPIFTLLWAGLNGLAGWSLYRAIPAEATVDVVDAVPAALLVLVTGFGAFLQSFYILGMSKQDGYRALRAPGSFLLVTVLMMAGVLAALVLAWQGVVGADRVVAWIIPVVLWVLAAEMVIGFVLNLYRPRTDDTDRRLSYDSRLMNLVAEPQQIGRSVAETLNYQFGFEVSQTWFYQLLQKALVPLLIFAVVVLIGMSSIVIVPEGEQVVVTHFGKIVGPVRHAGLHVKWPWPVGQAIFFDGGIRSLTIGAGHDREHGSDVIPVGTFAGRELMLWTKEHGHSEERNFLVAIPSRNADDQIPSVDVIKLVVEVQYQVVDPIKFGYQFVDADETLHHLAEREMVRYCSSATLFETDSPIEGRPEAIMGSGRQAMGDALQERIQAIISEEPFDLGVRIVSLNVVAVHPPVKTAEVFEKVLAARLAQRTQLHRAQAAARRGIIRVAGDVRLGQELALALRKKEELSLLASFQEAGKREEFDRSLNQAIQYLNHSLEETRGEMDQDALGGVDDVESDSRIFFDLLDAYRNELVEIQTSTEGDARTSVPMRAKEAEIEVDRLFAQVGGNAAVAMANAHAIRWKSEMDDRAEWSTFPAELAAWKANKQLYELDRYLTVWDRVLPNRKKYVICIDPDRVEMRINLEQSGRVEDRMRFDTVEEE